MKILLNSIAVDVFLAVIRANVTVDMEGIEESFSFFFPFNADKKPTAAELEEMGEAAKSKAFENHFAAKCGLIEEKEDEPVVAVAEVTPVPVRKPRGAPRRKSIPEDVPVAPNTPAIPEVIPNIPVEPTPELAEVPAPSSDSVDTPNPNPVGCGEVGTEEAPVASTGLVETAEVEYLSFNRRDRTHADMVGDWFSLANPDWRKTQATIDVCRTIAVAMEGAPFAYKGAEGLVANEALKAAAIKSVIEGKPLF